MSNKKHLSISLTRQEMIWGFVYLALELMVIPALLPLMWAYLFPSASAAFVNFLFYILNFTVILVIFRRFLRKSLIIARKNLGRTLLYALLGFLLYWVSNFALSALIFGLMPSFTNVNDASIAQISQDGFYLMAIGTVLLVPVAEECLFRGLLFRGFYGRSPFAACLISTLGFCAIHVMGYVGSYDALTLLVCFAQYIPAGLCLAWAYKKSNTIVTPILIHTLVNAIGIYALR